MKRLILLLVVLLSTSLFAQEESSVPLLDVRSKKYEQSLERFYQTRSVLRNTVPQVMEAELEAQNYRVGPGDFFKVSVFGELENEYEFQILPEGAVLIPTVGEIHVSGLTLKEAKQKILDQVKKNYIRADIRVNLTGLRKFRVYYTGEVKAPGTYFAQGSDRLSDIVEVAVVPAQTEEEVTSSLNDWADDTRIEVEHIDGTKNVYDLTRFYRLGDKSQNPNLRGGDIIYVPSIDLTDSYVVIEGNVGFQGIYPLKEDENLFEFLTRVGALSKKSNLENIVVERKDREIELDLLNDKEVRDFTLQSEDKVIIPTIYERVYVRGEVFRPGALPYRANYTAKDYIGEAGALDSADDIKDVIVIRQKTGDVIMGPDTIVEKGDTIILPKRPREVFKDYITILAPVISLFIATLALVQR